MGDIRFSCTKCGACCHNLGLPLTIDEAVFWLEDEGNVEIYCEADPWPTEPPLSDLRAAHRKRRSFPASSGSSKARITAILVAVVSGACKNLDENLMCRIYEERPLVCRIYPSEISPFIQLNIAKKACPPEAWSSGEIVLSDGMVVDSKLLALVEESRQTDHEDAPFKSVLCADLQIDVAALSGEGFVVHRPDRQTLLGALRRARTAEAGTLLLEPKWRFYSPAIDTAKELVSKGLVMAPGKEPENRYSFLWSHAPTAVERTAIAS